MRMGRSADKTVSQTLTTKLKDQVRSYQKTDAHRSQWARRMLTVQLNVPDSPFHYGGRDAWSMMFGLAEYFSVGWAYAAENRPGIVKKMLGIRQGGLPAKAMWNNLVQKKRTQFKAYISGRVLETVPSEKNDFGDPDILQVSDSNLVDDDGKKLKGFAKTKKAMATVAGRLGRDAVWRPLKALSTGGIASSKHIFWAHVIAAELTAIGIGAIHAVDAIGDATNAYNIDHPSYVNALEVGTTLPRLAWDNTVFAFSDNMDFNTMVANIAETATSGGENLSEIWGGMADGSPDGGVESAPVEAAPATNEYLPYQDTPNEDLFDNTGISYSSSLDQTGTAVPQASQDLLFEGEEFNAASNGAVNPETGIAIETDDDIVREEPDQDLFSLEE